MYAFERLGGVPLDKIRYDNLNSAVKRVLFGRTRQENDRWVAFRSHYGFDAFYCQPGHEGSHEKGGVEGEGGRFRRNHCVPMPVVDSIDELNALLEPPMTPTTTGGSATAPPASGMTGRSRRRCCGRCRPSRSTPR